MEEGGSVCAIRGLVVRRCHGPSVLLIGPICLRQADLRPGMGLKYDTDLLNLRSTGGECGGRRFVSEPCVCPRYGLGYFRITGPLSGVDGAFDTRLFSCFDRCPSEGDVRTQI